ncbi:MAG: Tfp pilus assembly protein FimT/FimU [Pyrinomonadaceae bacterium]
MNTHALHTPAAGARERGYALVALLAVMTVLMIAMMAAAPSLRQQARRELELEAIARGEEVAEAIRMYIRLNPRPQKLPTSMDELLEGVAPAGRTKKVMVLRASAARDPLSSSGEWRTIKPNDPAFVRFVRDLTEYAEGRTPNPTSDPALQGIPLPRLASLVTGLDSDRGDERGGEDESMSSSGPFVGVASRSRRDSIVTYYGIDHHDGWVFTPFYRR